MKREDIFPSNNLQQDDVRTQVVTSIEKVVADMVHDGSVKKRKPIMHFAHDQLSPLILNVTYWTVLESAYGPDSDGWVGKPIEIYVDPTVPNPRNPKYPGGICLRIPVAQAPAAQHPPRPNPAPAQQPEQAPVSQQTLLEKFARAKSALANAKTIGRIDEIAAHAKNYPWTDEQEDEISDAYHAAKERIQAQAPVRT